MEEKIEDHPQRQELCQFVAGENAGIKSENIQC
jgi:hypothetical protein